MWIIGWEVDVKGIMSLQRLRELPGVRWGRCVGSLVLWLCKKFSASLPATSRQANWAFDATCSILTRFCPSKLPTSKPSCFAF